MEFGFSQGKGVIYMDRLMPRKFIDVNTFVGHKWVFFRTDTKARLVGNQSTVYKPQPWQSSADPGTQTATRQIVLIQEPGNLPATLDHRVILLGR